MKSIKLALIGLLLVAGSSFSLRAADLHFIMCGGEVREADQTVQYDSQIQLHQFSYYSIFSDI